MRTVATRENGLRLAREAQPRPILLDLALLGIGGLTVLEGLRADRDLALIPVVVLSTTPDPTEVRQPGATACLPKSMDDASFLKRIRFVPGEQTGAGGAQQR